MSDYYKKIKQIISEKIGIDPNEITRDAFFEEDLNVGELELVDILSEIEEELKVELVSKKEDIASVQDLVDILAEKLD